MATFAARVALAGDPLMTPRIQIAIILTALAVAAEDRPADDACQDARTCSNARRAFARRVLDDPAGTVPRLRWIIACTPLADIPSPTDDDILGCVMNAWTFLSGA
jgi:hypothetical protein